MPTYQEKLKDPRWQKRRLEVFERDGWKCRKCSRGDKTLNIHHLIYLPNKEPWEYNNKMLLTLCEDCHLEESNKDEQAAFDEGLCLVFRSSGFFNRDIHDIISVFKYMKYHNPQDVLIVLQHLFTDQSLFDQQLQSAKDWPL
jgi:hypothetical protein